MADKVSIALGDYPCSAFTALTATNRQAVVDLLDECVELQKKRGLEIYGFTITMPCGLSQVFREHDDIPMDDLPCSCGREGHYLIRYNKENIK